MTNNWNIRFKKLDETMTVEKALNWLKETHVDFERMNGSVNLGIGCYAGFANCLDYANGIGPNGKKVRKNSDAYWARRRFANQRVSYFEISIAPNGATYYTILDEYSYNRVMKTLEDRTDITIEMFAA